MMTQDLESYIEKHIEAHPEHLRRLERETNLKRINGRMCSGHIQGRLLKMLTRMINTRNVLELGTFTGYSALCMAEGLDPDSSLTTIEIEDELEEPILEAFARAEEALKSAGTPGTFFPPSAINLRIGDALAVCREFPENSFDLIFIDADKRQYPDYLRETKRLLAPGGYILADNTLWDGHVAEQDRHDGQTEGIKEFNRLVAADPELEAVILPLRDGLTIIRKTN